MRGWLAYRMLHNVVVVLLHNVVVCLGRPLTERYADELRDVRTRTDHPLISSRFFNWAHDIDSIEPNIVSNHRVEGSVKMYKKRGDQEILRHADFTGASCD